MRFLAKKLKKGADSLIKAEVFLTNIMSNF